MMGMVPVELVPALAAVLYAFAAWIRNRHLHKRGRCPKCGNVSLRPPRGSDRP